MDSVHWTQMWDSICMVSSLVLGSSHLFYDVNGDDDDDDDDNDDDEFDNLFSAALRRKHLKGALQTFDDSEKDWTNRVGVSVIVFWTIDSSDGDCLMLTGKLVKGMGWAFTNALSPNLFLVDPVGSLFTRYLKRPFVVWHGARPADRSAYMRI